MHGQELREDRRDAGRADQLDQVDDDREAGDAEMLRALDWHASAPADWLITLTRDSSGVAASR